MRRRQDDISGLLIFCVDVHMGLDPLPRPHASTWAWPPPCERHKWMSPSNRWGRVAQWDWDGMEEFLLGNFTWELESCTQCV